MKLSKKILLINCPLFIALGFISAILVHLIAGFGFTGIGVLCFIYATEKDASNTQQEKKEQEQ